MNFNLSLIIFVILLPYCLQAEDEQVLSPVEAAPELPIIPKAIPVKPSNENNDEDRKALRALPILPNEPESKKKPLKALPLDKEEEVKNV